MQIYFHDKSAPDEVPVIEASDVLDLLPSPSRRNKTEGRSVRLVESHSKVTETCKPVLAMKSRLLGPKKSCHCCLCGPVYLAVDLLGQHTK